MSVKMTPKKTNLIPSNRNSSQALTPNEVKDILTSSIELTEEDFYAALKMMPEIYEQCEEEIRAYHDNSCIVLDQDNIKACKDIIHVLDAKGGEVLRSIESNLNEFWIWIGASFNKSISFTDDLPLLLDWIRKFEITIHTNSSDNGIFSIGFIIQIGKYVNLKVE